MRSDTTARSRRPGRPADLDDEALLDLVQRQTLRYFWDFAHPACGLARERSNVTAKYGLEAVTTGGTGFGVMAIIAGVARGWIGRDRGGRAAVDDGALPAQGRQLPRRLAALPERRHRPDDPLQPQGRRRRPRRDLLPDRRAALRPPVFRRRRRGGDAPARRDRLDVARGRVGLAHPRRAQRAHLALEPEQRLEHEPRDPRLERVPDHLRARRLRPALRDLARGLPPRLGRGPGLRERPQLRRHHAAARPGRRRAAVPRALFLPRARPARPPRPLCRLLGAERRPRARQPRLLHRQSARASAATARSAGA